MSAHSRVEYGDWQTPEELAQRAVDLLLGQLTTPPATVVEPTCGKGAFLVAAARSLPDVALAGYDINPTYVELAASKISGDRHTIRQADFFSVDWEREFTGMDSPILALGNPPWVTSSGLGALGSKNLPSKRNFKGLSGLDALTGKSNFDVSEWMILRLLQALSVSGGEATLAMLCKSAVARRVVESASREPWGVRPGAIWRIDAQRHFGAAVDAVLFMCRVSTGSPPRPASWPVFASLDAATPEAALGVDGGDLIADINAFTRTKSLAGASDPEWRSGIKHDCARIMELERRGAAWRNGAGEVVDIEPEFCYPLLKSSDIANGRVRTDRAVIVPQRALGDDTTQLRERAPKVWAYLSRHHEALGARKSSIYRGKPPFAIFGVGEYSFAPWKVAISGLYKRLRFCVVGPHDERPVVLDDTCYFLPFTSEVDAKSAASALESELAAEFFRGRVFWDAKRPINKAVLQALDLNRLLRARAGAAG